MRTPPAADADRAARRRTVGTLRAAAVAVLVLLVGVLGGGAQSSAQDGGYRYWSFWTQNERGAWQYAQQGPAQLRPGDGDVVGFRFTASRSAGEGATPRPDGDFAEICAGTASASGKKRIALVVDPGTAADAPSGETPPKARTACAQVKSDGSAADALAAEAPPLRYDSSALLCAIDGYPRSGCGERMPGGDDSGDRTDGTGREDETAADDGGTSVPLYVGIAVVALLAGGAAWQVRRRRP